MVAIACGVAALASILTMAALQPPIAFPMPVSPDLIVLGTGLI